MTARWSCIVVLGWMSLAAAAEPADVRRAAERGYIHGMTAALAESEAGRDAVPQLLGLLDDPSFARHDNVVAFLAYLGGAESTKALLASLDRPLPANAGPDEIRSRVLVPHALGRIARRGEPGALAALLAATAGGSRGGPIGAAARRGGYPPEIRDALGGEAIAALALAGGEQARLRLDAIASGRIVPDPSGPDPAPKAREAIALFDELLQDGRASATAPNSLASPASARSVSVDSAPSVRAVFYVPDPATRSRGHGLTFANHVNLIATKMTAARLDELLTQATRLAGIADFDADVPCCTAVKRSGGAQTFGSTSDTSLSIDTAAELSAVLNATAGRAKVVLTINYCGGEGTNILGCSYKNGWGMALVRMSDPSHEAVLWIHEYGHNIGLDHTGDSRFIMFYADSGANCGLSQFDCEVFHTPSSSARAIASDLGTCTDDGDGRADPLDNCPLVANDDQIDTNANGMGDACEECGTGDPDHDGVCPNVDNCLTVPNPSQGNFDGDPYGDACETGALRADADLSGRVDGFDLARLGRAFGASTGGARYDPDVDFDRDGTVDGADLALLAPVFGDRSF